MVISGEEDVELENKPDGGEKEKETLEQKPAMTYAEFKARKGRKRGKKPWGWNE